jgi:hypothetical protein
MTLGYIKVDILILPVVINSIIEVYANGYLFLDKMLIFNSSFCPEREKYSKDSELSYINRRGHARPMIKKNKVLNEMSQSDLEFWIRHDSIVFPSYSRGRMYVCHLNYQPYQQCDSCRHYHPLGKCKKYHSSIY